MTTIAAPPLDAVARYAADVVAGDVTAGRLVRLACERHMRDLEDVERGRRPDLRYNDEAAQRALGFFGMLEHTKGEWAGRRDAAGRALVLEPWQQFIVGSVFGWQHHDPVSGDWLRRFRIAYVEVARKNGKSTFAAAVANYLAFFDGEQGAEVYCAATKRDQAKIVFGEARRQMMKLRAKSPRVRGLVTVFTHNLHAEALNAKLEPLGADADTMDGLNTHGDIVDELHAHKTRALWDQLEESMAARRQPLHFAITTAGHDRESICWEQRTYAIQVLEGTVRDDTYFGFIAAIDEDDDKALLEYFGEQDDARAEARLEALVDSGVLRKANPNLGISVKLDYLTTKLHRARATPGLVNSTRQKHFNVWTTGVNRWLDVGRWRSLEEQVSRADLVTLKAWGGLDLAGTTDLNAFALIFRRAEGRYFVLPTFWMPEDNVATRVREDHVPYDVWARDGWIRLTPGNRRDDQRILDDIRALGAEFNVEEIGSDPWQTNYIATQLGQEGVTVVEIPQGFAHLSAAAEELEKLVESGNIGHDGNPVMAWMIGNAVADEDSAGHRKPSKSKSTERVDGVSALVTGLARVIVNTDDEPSIYETRGIRTL